jgi:hypothetical protein
MTFGAGVIPNFKKAGFEEASTKPAFCLSRKKI